MKLNLVQLGTLLLNGQPASIDAECRGEKISFGDSGLGEPIPFLDTGTSRVWASSGLSCMPVGSSAAGQSKLMEPHTGAAVSKWASWRAFATSGIRC